MTKNQNFLKKLQLQFEQRPKTQEKNKKEVMHPQINQKLLNRQLDYINEENEDCSPESFCSDSSDEPDEQIEFEIIECEILEIQIADLWGPVSEFGFAQIKFLDENGKELPTDSYNFLSKNRLFDNT